MHQKIGIICFDLECQIASFDSCSNSQLTSYDKRELISVHPLQLWVFHKRIDISWLFYTYIFICLFIYLFLAVLGFELRACIC
jgi:hypothetical protein